MIKRFEDKKWIKASQSRSFSKFVEIMSDFCRSHVVLANILSDVRKHLAQTFPNDPTTSVSYICRYMKIQLGQVISIFLEISSTTLWKITTDIKIFRLNFTDGKGKAHQLANRKVCSQ